MLLSLVSVSPSSWSVQIPRVCMYSYRSKCIDPQVGQVFVRADARLHIQIHVHVHGRQ